MEESEKHLRGRYKHLLNFTANLITLLIEGATFSYVWYSVYAPQMEMQYFRRGNWAVIGLYVIMVYFITRTMNGYKIGYLRLFDIYLSHVISIVIGGIIGYVEVVMVSRIYLSFVPILAMVAVQSAIIFIWVALMRWLYMALYPPRQMLLIYGNYSPEQMIEKISGRSEKYDICGVVSCFEDDRKLFDTIMGYEGVILYDLPAQRRNEILKYCYENSIRIYVTPNITDVILNASEEIHLFDTPLLLSRNSGLNITQLFFKRVFDLIISLACLVILLPFMVITAILIKLYDGGPVFYTQLRLTRDMEEFEIIKFRSMKMDSEADGARLAGREDDRITPIGRVIRRIHFDETPQLFNIIWGDMSFVGPRPERREIHEQYRESIPEFDYRLKVKAGLTGYAQVYGKYNTTPYDKLKLDLTYIQRYSLFLDFKLTLLTVKVIFFKENSEGVAADQETALVENNRVE